MVLGPDRGAAFVDSLQRAGRAVEAMFIVGQEDGALAFWATPRLRAELEWVEELPALLP